MKTVFVDANIIINVWRGETEPRTGMPLHEGSAALLKACCNDEVRGVLLTTTAMELIHNVRVRAELAGKSASRAVKAAENDLLQAGLSMVVPDSLIIGEAYQILVKHGLDPFDAILLAGAKLEKADAIISRDAKLMKKAQSTLPVLTPERFLR